MKKFIKNLLIVVLLFGSFKIIILEPDKQHTYTVTLPSFNSVVEFWREVTEVGRKRFDDFQNESLIQLNGVYCNCNFNDKMLF